MIVRLLRGPSGREWPSLGLDGSAQPNKNFLTNLFPGLANLGDIQVSLIKELVRWEKKLPIFVDSRKVHEK